MFQVKSRVFHFRVASQVAYFLSNQIACRQNNFSEASTSVKLTNQTEWPPTVKSKMQKWESSSCDMQEIGGDRCDIRSNSLTFLLFLTW